MTSFDTIYIVTLSIFNSKNELLLVRKKGSEFFQLPGGKKKEGEEDLKVIQREISEELSLDSSTLSINWLGEHRAVAVNEANTYVVGRMYISEENDNLAPKIDNEIEEWMWVSPNNYQSIKWAHLVKEFVYPIWAKKNDVI